jgi:hypothetical protein
LHPLSLSGCAHPGLDGLPGEPAGLPQRRVGGILWAGERGEPGRIVQECDPRGRQLHRQDDRRPQLRAQQGQERRQET